jgi:glycosyltransferase involved in cell wall biosynthesis
MSFLEAMAMGLCVVAPNAPTMNEYIQNGVNGLLYDPENPKPLDFSRAHELGKAARLSVQKGHDAWTASKKEIVSFLSEPAPGYVAKFHPLIIAKGRGISFARKIYRFLKRKLKVKKA